MGLIVIFLARCWTSLIIQKICLNLQKLFVDELEKHFTVIPEDVYAANPEKSDSEIVAILPWFAKPVVTEEMVKRMPKLVIVASISAGYNHLSE